jgi:putative nucleotidyltransferase with HDIG domain
MSARSGQWAYRAAQLWLAMAGTRDEIGLQHARALLTPREFDLFDQLQPSEQAHALNILSQLEQTGQQDSILLRAALLHDIGKARHRLTLWGRVLIVLGGRFLPGSAAQWGTGEPRGWKRPFVIAAQHPAWGAQMAAQAGSLPEIIELIRSHQDANAPEMGSTNIARLRTLQALDDQN